MASEMERPRSFRKWKADVTSYLLNLKKDDPEFQERKKELIRRLRGLRSHWVAPFLADLYEFTQKWGIPLPDYIIPSHAELERW